MGKKKISVMRLMSQHQRIQNNKGQTKHQQAVGNGSTERYGIDALQSNLPDMRNYVRLVRGVGNNLFECESLHNLLAEQKHQDAENNAGTDNDAQQESNVVLCELSRPNQLDQMIHANCSPAQDIGIKKQNEMLLVDKNRDIIAQKSAGDYDFEASALKVEQPCPRQKVPRISLNYGEIAVDGIEQKAVSGDEQQNCRDSPIVSADALLMTPMQTPKCFMTSPRRYGHHQHHHHIKSDASAPSLIVKRSELFTPRDLSDDSVCSDLTPEKSPLKTDNTIVDRLERLSSPADLSHHCHQSQQQEPRSQSPGLVFKIGFGEERVDVVWKCQGVSMPPRFKRRGSQSSVASSNASSASIGRVISSRIQKQRPSAFYKSIGIMQSQMLDLLEDASTSSQSSVSSKSGKAKRGKSVKSRVLNTYSDSDSVVEESDASMSQLFLSRSKKTVNQAPKRRKVKSPSSSSASSEELTASVSNIVPKPSTAGTKCCTSCKTRDTPIWREVKEQWGPEWKSVILCNACGLQWRMSGMRCSECCYVPRASEKRAKHCVKCRDGVFSHGYC
ncbi:hypothetical protein MIR68_007124 [Amoeboaphelidium protococcarum]|nr:hypothetical protein MIR68_007124 [Amoeboaphelidium protococcarum]